MKLVGRPMFSPQPRFRIYGTPAVFRRAARDFASRTVHEGREDVARLEQAVGQFIGTKHAIAMPQARVGIYLAIKQMIRPGAAVILSPYTIHDVVNMVICAGGRPVFADVEQRTCNIAAAEVERLIDRGTGAVLVTHLHGLACDVERIRAICRAHNVALIEDAAQSFGARVGSTCLGAFGDAGVFSFGMAKNVNSFYGGMVVTDNDDLASRLRQAMAGWPNQSSQLLRQRILFCAVGDAILTAPIFQLSTFWLFRFGYLHNVEAVNKRWRGEDDPQIKRSVPDSYLCRMTPMQARMLLPQLDRVDADSEVRLGHATAYFKGLHNLPGVIVPPLRTDASQIYLAYPVQVEDRHALTRHLMAHCRDVTVQHIRNCADEPCFAEFHRDCPNARVTANRVLLLPTYPRYGMSEVEKNISLIRSFAGCGP